MGEGHLAFIGPSLTELTPNPFSNKGFLKGPGPPDDKALSINPLKVIAIIRQIV
jgi:hypothetical protein